jgi:hypothetical protein
MRQEGDVPASRAIPGRLRKRGEEKRRRLVGIVSALALFFGPSLVGSAQAMSISAKALDGWRINDLTKMSASFRLFVHGAVATIVPEKGEAIPTIFVFKGKYKGSIPGTSIRAWENFVRMYTDARKDVLRSEKAYDVDGEPRFYTEALKDEVMVEGHETLYSAMLFIARSHEIMMLDYSAPKQEFLENLKKVQDVYQMIQVDE